MTNCLRYLFVVAAVSIAVPAAAQVASGVPVEQGERTVVPRCDVADDPAYGTTPNTPIMVGGGAMTVVAREQRYLKALRGPAGQVVSFKRSGSLPGPDKTMLDLYVLTWEGQEQPLSIYIDAYRWQTPRAPKGLVCGSEIGLTRPPADPFELTKKTAALAITWGAANDMTPIPLSAKEPDRYGVAWDQFRQAALVSRAATKAGKPLDPENPPAGVGLQPLMLVAYPLVCGERVVRPRAVFLTDANGGKAPTGDQFQGDGLAKALPGVVLPERSIGQHIRVNTARRTDLVVIQYEDPVCDSDAREIKLPVEITPARPMRQVPIALVATDPPADPNNQIRVTVVTDPEGRPQIVDYAGGPEALLDRAVQAMAQWVLEPMKWNGAPVVISHTIPVRTVSLPSGGVSPSGRPPGLDSLSTVNLTRTGDMPMMPPAQCPVTTDAAFGRSAARAIPVGGGTAQVVERARLYLLGLRGDKGQGLTIRRTGEGPSPAAGAVEIFEVTRTGDGKGTLLYFDATRWADIVAPQGFVCTGPMLLRPPQ
jgi:hypothetical protein